MRLFGYFVAEGHVRENLKEISFTFGIKESNFVNDVKKLMKNIFDLEGTINKREKNNRIDVLFYNVHLAKYLRENFGTCAYDKKIPEFIMYFEPELQKSFLYGVWHGDGYINLDNTIKPRAEYATSSWILAQELKVLLLRQKIEHSIYYENEKIDNKGQHHEECWRIQVGDYEALQKMSEILDIKFSYPKVSRTSKHSWFDEDYYYIPIRKIETEEFDGRLNNLEVENTHSYVTDAVTAHNCGDAMKMWIKVDKENDKIVDMRWSTFGCASAISSTSILSVMVTENDGMKIDDALKLKPQDIMNRLGGLPNRKFHCSVLGDKALRSAINDYFRKSGQTSRIVVEGARIIDPETKTTDKDIEEAVLEGALNLEDVQKKLKVGISNKAVVPAVEELIRFYKEKYFG
ncbi:iron-sulfur cluster assembly scaffold protein [Candidatus Woesearchaeota archaeon]|nr:iron-sulfur cluster assembly scaffold protein [Candidatus Woesearchaeota archaeon]